MNNHPIDPVSIPCAVSGVHERDGDFSTGAQGPNPTVLNVDSLDLFSAQFLDPSVFDGFSADVGDYGFSSSFLSS